MVESRYEIQIERGTNLIRFSIAGFFDAARIERFVRDRDEAFRRMACGINRHVTLTDVASAQLQSQEMFERFRTLMWQSDRTSRRMAFAVGSSLARMQVRRLVAGRKDVGIFEDTASAEAWLRASGYLERVPAERGCVWRSAALALPVRDLASA